jgi:hypothetical protein
MSTIAFDAVITLHKRHIVAAGLSGRDADAIDAVRTAVEAMDGAAIIDVETYPFPTRLADWVVLYPKVDVDALSMQTLRQSVQMIALEALQAVGQPYWAIASTNLTNRRH